jgi:hypothetical protein
MNDGMKYFLRSIYDSVVNLRIHYSILHFIDNFMSHIQFSENVSSCDAGGRRPQVHWGAVSAVFAN